MVLLILMFIFLCFIYYIVVCKKKIFKKEVLKLFISRMYNYIYCLCLIWYICMYVYIDRIVKYLKEILLE